MCQVSVYLDDKKIMENVIWVEPTVDGIVARGFFEAPTHVKGTLEGIDLLKNRVLMTSPRDNQSSEPGAQNG